MYFIKSHSYTSVLLLLFLLNVFSQEIVAAKQFRFRNDEINYIEIGYDINKMMYYNKVVFFISNTNERTKKLEQTVLKFYDKKKITNRNLYCFVSIPNTINTKNEKEMFFLRFAASVLSSRKLIDSELVVFSEGDFTEKYKERKKENDSLVFKLLEANSNSPKIELKEPLIHLNKINQLYIDKNEEEIKKILDGM